MRERFWQYRLHSVDKGLKTRQVDTQISLFCLHFACCIVFVPSFSFGKLASFYRSLSVIRSWILTLLVCFCIYLFQLLQDRHSHRLRRLSSLRFLLIRLLPPFNCCIARYFHTFLLPIVTGRTRLGYWFTYCNLEIYACAPSDCDLSILMRASAETFEEYVFF